MRFVQRGYLATLVGHIVGGFLGGWFAVIMGIRADGNLWEDFGILLLWLLFAIPAGAMVATGLALRIFAKLDAFRTAIATADPPASDRFR